MMRKVYEKWNNQEGARIFAQEAITINKSNIVIGIIALFDKDKGQRNALPNISVLRRTHTNKPISKSDAKVKTDARKTNRRVFIILISYSVLVLTHVT